MVMLECIELTIALPKSVLVSLLFQENLFGPNPKAALQNEVRKLRKEKNDDFRIGAMGIFTQPMFVFRC